MKNLIYKKRKTLILALLLGVPIAAQEQSYSLKDCINYALDHSTVIARAANEIQSQKWWLEQNKAARYPNLTLSANQSFSSVNSYSENEQGSEWTRDNTSNLNLSLNSNLTLYSGAKLKNAIIQGQTNLKAAESDIQTQKDLVSLNVFSAYIAVMLAKEQLKNDEAALEVTEQQLDRATIRMETGVLSPADFLNMKSQAAIDKANLTNAQSNLRTSLVALMQLMNMPVSNTFDIAESDFDTLLLNNVESDAARIYETALELQPGITTAKLDLQSAETGIQLAKAEFRPVVSLNTSLNTSYGNSMSAIDFTNQISEQLTPSLGLTLSIPIYQRKQAENNIVQAEIAADNMKLNLADTKNNLRKAIEQTCADAQSAHSAYLSSLEQLEAQQESYRLSDEMFAKGMMSSVDYLTSKNNLTSAESDLTRAKYTVILQNRIVNYYMGSKIQ